MKKVEFERITFELSDLGFVIGQRYIFHGVEEIIKERIQNGWDYQGHVPIQIRKNGEIETISLIFIKDDEN